MLVSLPLCIAAAQPTFNVLFRSADSPKAEWTVLPNRDCHECVWTRAMHVQTKFLRLCKPVSIGDRIDNWRVCWLGGWDKCRVFFIVMVEREYEQPVAPCSARVAASESRLPVIDNGLLVPGRRTSRCLTMSRWNYLRFRLRAGACRPYARVVRWDARVS